MVLSFCSHVGHHLHNEHGASNRNACSLCEPLVGQLVCGTDGNTYTTLCHAVHCAGLTEKQVTMGACTEMVSWVARYYCDLYMAITDRVFVNKPNVRRKFAFPN